MSKSTTDLALIARAGGGISIPCTKSTPDLCAIAQACATKGATLIIRGANKKSTPDLCSIAAANPGKVLFEFE